MTERGYMYMINKITKRRLVRKTHPSMRQQSFCVNNDWNQNLSSSSFFFSCIGSRQ